MLTDDFVNQPVATASALIAAGKGLLAADESTATLASRFKPFAIESTVENQRRYRQLLFTTAGIEKYISGVVLFDETIRQRDDNGRSFVEILTERGIIPGIKVDRSTIALAGSLDERITEGLDGLRERLEEYRSLGARFAKWRAVITIGEGRPTSNAMEINAHSLASYAALCQEAGLVPIVEPEVLMEGDHSLERTYGVTEATLRYVFAALRDQNVILENMLLKPGMVLPGASSVERPTTEEVAELTVKCLRRTVPAAVPGIVFLSGGQAPQTATEHLNAINTIPQGHQPWELSFSFARALQEPALEAWRGEPGNVPVAQRAFLHRARCNGAARDGRYTAELENETDS